jgi:hypothetical protein
VLHSPPSASDVVDVLHRTVIHDEPWRAIKRKPATMTNSADVIVRDHEDGCRIVIEIPGRVDLTNFHHRGDASFITVTPVD